MSEWKKAMAAGSAVLVLLSSWACSDGGQEQPAPVAQQGEAKMASSVHDFTMKCITGEDVPLASYRGKVLLIVNVASKCGFTKQYAGLQALFEKYGARGLVVLGFPANNFMDQEPGTNAEIASFCSTKFGVSFPMFEKISVTGKDMHPLYAYLTSQPSAPEKPGKISWNFNKFLVDGQGRVAARFGSRTAPEAPELLAAIEKLLPAE